MSQEEQTFFKELIDIYSKETKKIGTDIDKIRVKLKKVEDEISKKQSENKNEEFKLAFEDCKKKLEVLKETKVQLKRDMFVKRQESKMLSTRRKIKKNQITSMKKLQRQRTRNGGVNVGTHEELEIDYGLEREKDKQISLTINKNSNCIKLLTRDVEDIEQRIIATEVKLNVFILPDYEKLNKQYTELTDCISDLNEYKAKMKSQIDILNEQFKLNIIEKFKEFNAVEKLDRICFNAIQTEN